MEEHDVQKFMELVRYLHHIRDDKVKIQSFFSGLPHSYKKIIEFSNPQTLEETIRMDTHCYEKTKGKVELWPISKEKPKGRFETICNFRQRSKFDPRKR